MQISPIQIIVGLVGLLWAIGMTIAQMVFFFGRWAGKHESKDRVMDEFLSPTKIGYQVNKLEQAVQKLNEERIVSDREHAAARRIMEERIYALLAGHLTTAAFDIFAAQYQRDQARTHESLEKLFMRRGDGVDRRGEVRRNSVD